MKVLLDEDMPRQIKQELADHDAWTVREMGWNGIKNGVLHDHRQLADRLILR